MDLEISFMTATRKMDGDSLTGIFELYAPALYKYAFRLCNNAVIADQIVGEVFVRFIDRLPSGKLPGLNLRAYLYEIAYKIFIEDARYANLFIPSETGSIKYGDAWSIDLSAEDRRLFETIQWALMNELTDDQRHVVLLRFVEGFSLKETAAIIGKKVGNVKVIQNRAIAALREALDDSVVETRTITLYIRRMAHA